MATNILMPALSPTMTEGTLARWLKKEGETITAGDVIAEIETDKATMEVEAVDEGVLGKILVPEGTANVAVNAPIAVLVDKGEAVPDTAPKTPPKPAAKVAEPPPPAATPAPAPPHANGHDQPARIAASPLARRIAGSAGIDLVALKGSGPNGRIVRADVEGAKPAPAAPEAPVQTAPAPAPASTATPTPTPPPTPSAKPAPAATSASIAAPHKLVPHSNIRKVIAKRLTEAKQTVPHFYLSSDIAIDALLDLRAKLNARAPKSGDGVYKLSVNDFIIKAAALTLRQIPKVNASFLPEGTAFYQDVDISIAVAIPDGLITPIIRKADGKSLVAISAEMKELAARAKTGKLKPDEYQGGGFSISNLGMFGIDNFSAIINPPQSAIMAVGAGVQRAVVRHGALAVATMMTCTLSVDHRVVDGALGAEWLQAFKTIMEDPLGILL